jgi:hypothetical protein
MKKGECIAVDLDGTLAYYTEWKGIEHIGEPIPAMLARIKLWLEQGISVKILTARATDIKSIRYIEDWLEEHGIGGLEITNKKTPDIKQIWDDRAVQVIPNTGQPIQYYMKEQEQPFSIFSLLENDFKQKNNLDV